MSDLGVSRLERGPDTKNTVTVSPKLRKSSRSLCISYDCRARIISFSAGGIGRLKHGNWSILYDVLFAFKTPHIVHVRNFKIGLTHRLVQLLIFGYVIGYAIIYKKGYQDTDLAQSTVTTKVKGIVSTVNRFDLPPEYRRVWDTVDYVIPPQENGAFFIMTNAIVNKPQTFGTCQEALSKAPCTNNSQCIKDQMTNKGAGNGLMTGNCVGQQNKACEIEAWCPVEADDPPNATEPLLPQAFNFTVLIKNSVSFPKFGVVRRNVPESVDANYFKCRYSRDDPKCPVISIGTIIQESGADFEVMSRNGGVINIDINWDCDFDHRYEECQPKFTFRVMESGSGGVGAGWNFRFASYYRDSNGTLTREVIKAFGILFVFNLHGKAGKFFIVPLLTNIGAGLALLSLATIVCDIILLNCVKDRQVYKDHKFQVVDEKSVENATGASLDAIPQSAPPRQRRSDSTANGRTNTGKPKSVSSKAQNGNSAGTKVRPKSERIGV